MNNGQPPQGAPKDILRAIRIFYISILAGAIIFSIIVIGLVALQGAAANAFGNSESIVLTVAAAIAIMCFVAARSGFKKKMESAKGSLISLAGKLNIYRDALIKYVALCEGPALLGIILFFVTGNYYFFVITVAMIAAMLLKAPTVQRVTNEMSLNAKEQMELE